MFSEFGEILAVRIRRTDLMIRKGSVYVEFATAAAAQAMLAAKDRLRYNGQPFVKVSKKRSLPDPHATFVPMP